jgi:hypothetical protein
MTCASSRAREVPNAFLCLEEQICALKELHIQQLSMKTFQTLCEASGVSNPKLALRFLHRAGLISFFSHTTNNGVVDLIVLDGFVNFSFILIEYFSPPTHSNKTKKKKKNLEIGY